MSNPLIKTTSIFSFTTLLSRILGFIRDSLVAQFFGVGPAVDAFYAAYKIPSLMHKLFAESALIQVFTPVFSEYRAKQDPFILKRFFSRTIAALICILSAIVIFGMCTTSSWIRMVAPGLDAERLQIASHFLVIIFPYLLLVSLAAIGSATMNCYRLYWGAAFTPVLPNICLIASVFVLSHYFAIPITSQVWGILLTGSVQFLFVLPFLSHLKLLTWPRFDWWREEGVLKIMKLILPALLCSASDQIGTLITNIYGSYLQTGTLTWLYYANRLVYFPLGVLGVALATVLLPLLSNAYAANTPDKFNQILNWGLRYNLIVGLPAAILLGLLAGPLVASLYGYGKFTEFDVIQTQYAIMGYAVGLPAFMLVRALSSAFFARQDILTPLKIMLQIMVVQVLLNKLLTPWLAHTGLTLASSLASWVQAGLLFKRLRLSTALSSEQSTEATCQPHVKGFEAEIGQEAQFFKQSSWKIWTYKVLIINSLLSAFIYAITPKLSTWIQWSGGVKLTTLIGLLSISILLYLTGLRIMRLSKLDLT